MADSRTVGREQAYGARQVRSLRESGGSRVPAERACESGRPGLGGVRGLPAPASGPPAAKPPQPRWGPPRAAPPPGLARRTAAERMGRAAPGAGPEAAPPQPPRAGQIASPWSRKY
ncbi:Hypothetical predicted protein [Marmota monax]|uniref:Uncharacterized protein n=1 Tax=Marmota monax TaxID=9995 RepID=A0A5E4AYF9_MARMO|nr:hypothetical protein GHT09_016773 [Marmota monax]VTJ61751.1 Hypothetical predicted protein [Marmota monax]